MEGEIIKILIIEDNPYDIAIMERELAKYHFDMDFATSGEEGLKKLKEERYDIVVADYAMPGMTGLDVLDRMNQDGYDIPSIIITGVGSERIAVEAMKKGAYDYLVKSLDPSWLEVFPLVIQNSVEKSRTTKEREKLEKEIERLVGAINTSADGIIVEDKERVITSWNKGAQSIFGYKAHEIMGKDINIIIPEDLQGETSHLIQGLATSGFIKDYETERLTKDGKRIPISVTLNVVKEEEEIVGYVAILRDIAERKKMEVMLKESYLGTVRSLASAIEVRHPYTRGHSDEVARYSVMIAKALGLSYREIELIEYAGILHDIGKIGTPEAILEKPSSLNPQEWNDIKRHPFLSRQLLLPIKPLSEIISWIYHHHERYDGKGYLDGLKGKEIPLGARILAVADAYSAMTSERPYRKAKGKEQAIEELREAAGTQFDPEIVEVFIEALSKESSGGGFKGRRPR